MFTVRKYIELDAGHRVPYHGSQCRNLHGHRYRVTAVVAADALVEADTGRSDAGMVLDFGVIKQTLMDAVHKPCDHKLLLWNQDPLLNLGKKELGLHELLANAGVGGWVLLPCIPTAEELARYWGEEIQRYSFRIWDERLRLVEVEVRETPSSIATWTVS